MTFMPVRRLTRDWVVNWYNVLVNLSHTLSFLLTWQLFIDKHVFIEQKCVDPTPAYNAVWQWKTLFLSCLSFRQCVLKVEPCLLWLIKVKAKALIFHMRIPCDRTFPWKPRILPGDLDFRVWSTFWKTLTLLAFE